VNGRHDLEAVVQTVGLSLPAHPDSVAKARRLVDVIEPLPPERAADVQLVLSELVTNAVLHAGLDPNAQIEVSLRRDADRCLVMVDDHGTFSASACGERPSADRGGRGLAIVDAVCVAWEARGGLVLAWIAI
jgi:anti-sigma regulatory factor (Ser/Thr protein kinase)